MASEHEHSGSEATAWHVITGSARGAAHRASGMPNQDSAAQHTTSGTGGAIVVAVADGHGHERHFRSADGSALAVDVACRVASRLAVGLGARARRDELDAAVRDDLAQAIVLDWRAGVGKQLVVRPYTVQEQSTLDLAGDGPEIPYGTTLLLAMITARWLVCAQIGDGDLLAVYPDGRSFYPLADDSRLDGQRTTSLCQPDAVASFRTCALDLSEMSLLALLLATDGYSNAQAAELWQLGVGQDLAKLAAEHDHHWFERQVPSWAERCASADGSADDTTIALLLQPGAASPAARLARGPSQPVQLGQAAAAAATTTTPPPPPPPPDSADVVPAWPSARFASPTPETAGPVSPAPPGPARSRPVSRGRHGASHRRRVGIIVAVIAAAVLAAIVTILVTHRSTVSPTRPARAHSTPTSHKTVGGPRVPSPAVTGVRSGTEARNRPWRCPPYRHRPVTSSVQQKGDP